MARLHALRNGEVISHLKKTLPQPDAPGRWCVVHYVRTTTDKVLTRTSYYERGRLSHCMQYHHVREIERRGSEGISKLWSYLRSIGYVDG